MSASRTFVVECELCRTKFEADPGECPVCGSASLRAIREAVAAAEDIPVPTGRTKPPAALRRRGATPSRRAFEGSKVRRLKGAAVSAGSDASGTPPRGPDGRCLPRKKAGGGVAAARSRAPSAPRAAAPIRIDVADTAKRLEAAMAELRDARKASFAAARRRILAESAVRRIRNEIRRAEEAARVAFRGRGGRKGGLHAVLKTLGGLFTALVAALLWK